MASKLPLPSSTPLSIPKPKIQLAQIPNYGGFTKSKVGAGRYGKETGKIIHPKGVAIEPDTGNMYVVSNKNKRIQIFSQTGAYLIQFGVEHFESPWGIVFHSDYIYVTDTSLHSILKFRIEDLAMIKQTTLGESESEGYTTLRQPAVSTDQLLYVPDEDSHSIQVLTTDLEFKHEMKHELLTSPVDIQFVGKEMFVLSCETTDGCCIHVFTPAGEITRSFIPMGKTEPLHRAYFFCIDKQSNIVITDFTMDDIKVYSPQGQLMHTIGQMGHKPGKFLQPTGVAIYKSKLICVSGNENYGVQVFSV